MSTRKLGSHTMKWNLDICSHSLVFISLADIWSLLANKLKIPCQWNAPLTSHKTSPTSADTAVPYTHVHYILFKNSLLCLKFIIEFNWIWVAALMHSDLNKSQLKSEWCESYSAVPCLRSRPVHSVIAAASTTSVVTLQVRPRSYRKQLATETQQQLNGN